MEEDAMQADETRHIFVCGHNTDALQAYVSELISEVKNYQVHASNPRFNKFRVDQKNWNSYNLRNFGPLRLTLQDLLLDLPGVREAWIERFGNKFMIPEINTFALGKNKKLSPLIAELKRRDLDQVAAELQSFQDFIEWVKGHQDEIKSQADWIRILTTRGGIRHDWQNFLLFDNVLKVFGLTDQKVIDDIRTTVTPGDDEKRNLEKYSIAWISKLLDLWTLPCSMADVGNLFAAMLGLSAPLHEKKYPDVPDILPLYERVRELWIHSPDDLISMDDMLTDIEFDDDWSEVVNQALRVWQGREPCRMHFQLPTDGIPGPKSKMDANYEHVDYSAVAKLHSQRGTVFRDYESHNGKAILNKHRDLVVTRKRQLEA